MAKQTWTVGEVAALTRVSVRTLHHYDALGLLRPHARTESSYRLYTSADLTRLGRILAWRELGLGLGEIAALLEAGPDAERAALHAHAGALSLRLRRTQAQLDAVLNLLEGESRMKTEDMKTLFDGFEPAQYEEEAEQRWGDSDAYRQSRERTRRYGKADWERIKAEGEALNARYLALMDAGAAPDSEEARAAAEAHRAYFSRWFYDASAEMMAGLAQMWVEDERFTRNIDRARPGLAAYQSAAVLAWASSQGAGQDT